MKITLTQPIVNLAGKSYQDAEQKDLTLGKVLAEILAVDQSGGKMKLFSLAQKSFTEKELEVDQADFNLIKSAAEKTQAYQGNAIVIGQVLELLDKVK